MHRPLGSIAPLLAALAWISSPIAGTPAQASARAGELLPLDAVATHAVAVPDLSAVAREDLRREAEGLPPRYAIGEDVRLSPWSAGTWEDLDAESLVWRLRLQGPGAVSLNLGFAEYHVPEEGALHLYSADRTHVVRPFTADDNEEHGELWTPAVLTDDLVVELLVPRERVSDLRLTLTRIGYGYRGFGERVGGSSVQRSGACNVDVVCPQGDPWRLEIPSVGVISTGGSTFCTGFLVNNVRGDKKPYFMTASHCGVRAGNAASLVVYWNFENSTCRTPGSAQSGQGGNGSLSQFNTGSIHRASSSASDFTLVELDDDPDPSFEVSFAGWDATGDDASSAVAIHHPNTDEKRISFENQPTTTTSYLSNSVPGNGTHVRVEDWDLGTTEPGSSGSPLFDQDHRVIGQLHGGFASCSSQTSDWYGKLSVSWTGGGSAGTRLSDWLDPDGTGTLLVDTLAASGTLGRIVRFGPEPTGANIGRLASSSTPTIGQSMTIAVSRFVNSSSVSLVLSAQPAAVPFKGGLLLVDLSSVVLQRQIALSGGNGSLDLTPPEDPELVGLTAYAQAGGGDPTLPGGFALSTGIAITLGD